MPVIYLTLTTRQAWADAGSKVSQNVQKCQHFGMLWLYLELSWEMHSNKYMVQTYLVSTCLLFVFGIYGILRKKI